MNFVKIMYIFLGTLSLIIGLVGIILPGLPTTPFLLLTAGLYMRSSDTLYQKVMSNRYIGKYISDYQSSKSISVKVKLYIIAMMWTMIFISSYFFIPFEWAKIIVIISGIIGTIVVGFVVKTKRNL